MERTPEPELMLDPAQARVHAATHFFNSLLAAFRMDEIRAQLAESGLAHLRVEQVSDRHVAVWGRVSP